MAGYCAAKYAVVGLIRALSMEFARAGITVYAVCAGLLIRLCWVIQLKTPWQLTVKVQKKPLHR